MNLFSRNSIKRSIWRSMRPESRPWNWADVAIWLLAVLVIAGMVLAK